MLLRILLAVEARATRRRLRELLDGSRLALTTDADARRLWESVSRESFDLLVACMGALPGDAAAAITTIRQLPDGPEIVLLHPIQDPEAAERAELLAAGALAVLDPRWSDELLRTTLETVLVRRREQRLSLLSARQGVEPCSLGDFASAAPAMHAMLELSRAVVRSNSGVLLLGETGVGKERLARAIHAEGPRRAGPFVAVNSGALTESLAESELFGHEKGAFTGAVRARRGLFELAHQGTLFFDEVSEMPPALQVKLLRALEERSIRRVGGEQTVPLDVRIIAATNRDLEAEVRAGRFREDLYYRLAVVVLALPPIRERREDLPDLARRCLETVCARLGRHAPRLEPEALRALVQYSWPGNVRELANVLERATLLCRNDEVTLGELPVAVASRSPGFEQAAVAAAALVPGAEPEWWRGQPLLEARRKVSESFERTYLIDTLRCCSGRVGQSAKRAGVSPRSMSEMIKRHGLHARDYR